MQSGLAQQYSQDMRGVVTSADRISGERAELRVFRERREETPRLEQTVARAGDERSVR